MNMGGPAVFLTSSGLVIIIVEDFNIFGQFGFEGVIRRLAAELSLSQFLTGV